VGIQVVELECQILPVHQHAQKLRTVVLAYVSPNQGVAPAPLQFIFQIVYQRESKKPLKKVWFLLLE